MGRFGQFSGMNGRFCGGLLTWALMLFAPTAGARQSSQGQQMPPSLGEAARRARAEKQAAPTAKKVWTNDNLPTNPFAISVVGPPLPAEEIPDADEQVKNEKKPAASAEKPKTLTEMEAELAKAQEKLALHEKELDLSRRDAALQQQAFYADPRANQDEAGQAQLAEVQKHLDAMQQDLESERAKVAELLLKVEALKKTAPTPGEGSGALDGTLGRF
jgi:hypothetical protein